MSEISNELYAYAEAVGELTRSLIERNQINEPAKRFLSNFHKTMGENFHKIETKIPPGR